jgi:large subunit ribosomal protein L2
MKIKSLITTSNPHPALISILRNRSGRDSSGKISVRHQGGRHKRYYRIIDFKRNKRNVSATVMSIEYDPNRNANISLLKYEDGEVRYIICPHNLSVGDKLMASENAEIGPGNALPLKSIPIGIDVHNVEIFPGQGAKFVRSAGSFATIIAKEGNGILVKLMSGEVRKFSPEAYATVGRVGNITHKDEIIGKAGRKRHMGVRPTVRGTAQNPRSHPHGGGEGRSGEGMHPKTPWGKKARGVRTRNPRKWTSRLITTKRPR